MSAPAPAPEVVQTPQAPPDHSGNGATPPATPATPTPEPSWRDRLPVEMRNDPTLGRYKTEADLAKAFIERNELIGKKGIIKPGENATPEEIALYHDALGVPKTAEAYSVAKEFKPPEGLPWNEKLLPALLPVFKQAGVTDEGAKLIVEHYAKAQHEAFQSAMTEMENSRTQADVDLRREWGRAYDAKLAAAQRAFKAYSGGMAEEAGALLLADGTPLAEHPLVQRIFAAVGEGNSEHRMLGAPDRRMTMTPEEAGRTRARKMADPDFVKAMTDSQHPEHASAMAEWQALNQAATG